MFSHQWRAQIQVEELEPRTMLASSPVTAPIATPFGPGINALESGAGIQASTNPPTNAAAAPVTTPTGTGTAPNGSANQAAVITALLQHPITSSQGLNANAVLTPAPPISVLNGVSANSAVSPALAAPPPSATIPWAQVLAQQSGGGQNVPLGPLPLPVVPTAIAAPGDTDALQTEMLASAQSETVLPVDSPAVPISDAGASDAVAALALEMLPLIQ
jgi:hypothetical protein